MSDGRVSDSSQEVGAGEDLDERGYGLAAGSLIRTELLLTRYLDAVLRPHGISFPRFSILSALHEQESISLGQLADSLAIHPTTITSSIDRLERDGLAARAAHPTDRRATLATLTPAGRRVFAMARADLTAKQFGMNGLSLEENRELSALLRSVRMALGDSDNNPLDRLAASLNPQ
jgi:DNA-binding MarR family transcriptional regulator